MFLNKNSDTLRRKKGGYTASNSCSSPHLGAVWSYSTLLDFLLTFEIRKDRTVIKVNSVLLLLSFNKTLMLNLSSQFFLTCEKYHL